MSANTSKPIVTAEHLRTELAAATERLAALETEYEGLLADPDAIQEDRDSTRILLEATRAVAQSAQDAVERIEQGTYGRCSVCGEAIPAERLEAIPDTDTCVRCHSGA
ncbi:MAG: TraR/DksA C4-type zinc finger protein [Ilumatobacteraceae bacterium]